MKKLGLVLMVIFFTLNLRADYVCQDPVKSKEFIQHLCEQYMSCSTTPAPVTRVKKVTHKKKRRIKPNETLFVGPPAPPIAPVTNIVVQVVPQAPPMIAKEVPKDDFWLMPFVNFGFTQFDVDSNLGSTRIISREDQEFGLKATFTYEGVNPFVKFSIRHLDLEAPANQSFDHSNDNLYNASFGVEKRWDRFALMADGGYRHELYFRGYNNPVISVDKFFVPYGEVEAKFKLIHNKSFDLAILGNYSHTLPFDAHLSGNGAYHVNDSNSFQYGLEFSKKFRAFSFGSSLLMGDKNKSSDQGSQKDNSVNFLINIEIPFSENF